MSTATLNGRVAGSCKVTIPLNGAPIVDVYLTDTLPVSARSTVTVGTLALVCSPVRTGQFMGSTFARMAGGSAGWMRAVPAKGYTQANGLQGAQIVGDAAREVGETIGAVVPGSVGNFYGRMAGAASQVFALFPRNVNWWVDYRGLTQVGTRTPGLVTARVEVLDFNPDLGRVTLTMDDTAALVPGLTLASPLFGSGIINCIGWTVTESKLLGEVWLS